MQFQLRTTIIWALAPAGFSDLTLSVLDPILFLPPRQACSPSVKPFTSAVPFAGLLQTLAWLTHSSTALRSLKKCPCLSRAFLGYPLLPFLFLPINIIHGIFNISTAYSPTHPHASPLESSSKWMGLFNCFGHRCVTSILHTTRHKVCAL